MRGRIIIFSMLALLVIFALTLFLGYKLFTSSMGKPLSLVLKSATPTAMKAAAVQPTATKKPAPTATKEAAPAVAKEPEKVCSATGTTLVLFVGADFSLGVPPFGADAVRLVKLDFDAPAITVVAFPRDLVLDTAALRNPDQTSTPLGLSYFYMKQATQGTADEKILAATNLVAQVLYDNFAVQPNYYLTLQLDSVGAMIDEIGGVDINIPAAITTEHDVTYNAGMQNLNGRLSAEYVRFLFPGDEAARMKRQEEFIKALQRKALQAGTLTHLPELINQFNQAIVTDLSPEMLVDYACLAKAVPGDQIKFYEISGQLVSKDANGRLIPDKAQMKEFLAQVFGP